MVLLTIVHFLQFILLFLICSSVLLLFSYSVISACDPMIHSRTKSLSSTMSWIWLKFMSIQSVMPSNHLILCCLHFFFPSSFPKSASFPMSRLFPSGGKILEFNFSIRYSHEYSGLIPFSNDWFDLFSVQGTLKSLLQHHNSKASIFQRSAFFMVQRSHPHMTTGRNIALTRHPSFGNVKSLLFITWSRFVIAFLPRSKCLLVLWLQSPSTVILEPKKIKSVTVSPFSPFIFHEVMRSDTMILVF